ncbi:MAG: zinc-dependent metalloprotease [Planctomycetes bacterium]|nr:zinc-dependent metalloprotease [Planctomycetota bacterium]
MRTRTRCVIGLMIAIMMVVTGSAFAQNGQNGSNGKPNDKPNGEKKPDFPPFKKVSEGYKKIVSIADGKPSLYTIWTREKDGQILAELPQGWKDQKYYFAVTQSGGAIFAGLQGPTRYAYWKRFDKRMALIEPQLATRSTGDPESKSSVARLFTDRILADVPIVTMGPGGQPVINLNDLLIKNASKIFSRFLSGLNPRLTTITKAKAFPKNIEVAFEVPNAGGRLQSYHFSISLIPDNTGYKPRIADDRIGYFTTVYRDLGKYQPKDKWVRYINRWNLEKRDPKLKLSPPKEPIIFYIEHTVPVRYRRWVREGILWWNDAFAKIGIDNAIQVYYQDKATEAHMDKDPEDIRYNFLRWLNNDISVAIGPSRAHPLTGQIFDADIVLTDGWIRAFWGWYHEQMPEIAAQSLAPETLIWLEDYPEWDPRIILASPARREELLARRARGESDGLDLNSIIFSDPALLENEELAMLNEWMGENNAMCLAAHGRAFDMAFGNLTLDMLGMLEDDPEDEDDDTEMLDGIPEWFVGPMLADLVAHEVGHTLGLRHNFKASSVYSLAQINSEEWKGKKPFTGSVMDYNPANFNMESGEVQGDFAMNGVGPYDYWAIEFGYTFGDTKETLKRVAEPELAYLTDDDTRGPDPLARRYDFGSDPLEYAENQMRLVRHQRERILDKFVKDGESWSGSRRGYSITLSMQMRMLSMMANWVGGAHVNRDHKGDPNGRLPIEVVGEKQQRDALDFVLANAFHDEAFGLTTDLLLRMTVDKWRDGGAFEYFRDSTWDVHDRIMSVQASTLTMLLNPNTLERVYDNEFRTPADEDALTLPELMTAISTTIFTELNTELNGATFTNRKPMVSSLRRNLQSAMIDRLIGLSKPSSRLPRPIRTLSMHELRSLNDRIDAILENADSGQLDQYTLVHFTDLADRIERTINRVQVTDQ